MFSLSHCKDSSKCVVSFISVQFKKYLLLILISKRHIMDKHHTIIVTMLIRAQSHMRQVIIIIIETFNHLVSRSQFPILPYLSLTKLRLRVLMFYFLLFFGQLSRIFDFYFTAIHITDPDVYALPVNPNKVQGSNKFSNNVTSDSKQYDIVQLQSIYQ